MENGKRKNSVLLTVIIAITLLVAMVGATFAYFSATSTTVISDPITTGTLNISLTGTEVEVTNIKPTTFTDYKTDSSNPDIVFFAFNVKGNTDFDAKYVINLQLQSDITLSEGKTKLEYGQEPAVQEGEDGKLEDIKWVMLDSSGNKLSAKDGITGTFEGNFKTITSANITPTFTKTVTTGSIDDSYYLAIYIEDTGVPQNKLQELDFAVNLSAIADQNVE